MRVQAREVSRSSCPGQRHHSRRPRWPPRFPRPRSLRKKKKKKQKKKKKKRKKNPSLTLSPSLLLSPLFTLSSSSRPQKNQQQGRKCIERVFGTLLGSSFGLLGVLFHDPWAATLLAFASGLCGELLMTQAGFDCAGKLVAVTYVSVAFPSFWRLGLPRLRGELRVAMVDAFTRTVAAVIGVVLVTVLSIVWFPRTGSDKAVASTAELVGGLRRVAGAAFEPLVGGARPRPAPAPDSDLETEDEGSDEEGVGDEVQEDDGVTEVDGGASSSVVSSSSRRSAKPRGTSSAPRSKTARAGNKQHRVLATATDLLPAFSAPKPPGSRPRARERHREQVTEALFHCSAVRDKIRDSLAAAKNELVVARVPSIPVLVRGTTGACLPRGKRDGGDQATAATNAAVSKNAATTAAVDVEAATAAADTSADADAAVAVSVPKPSAPLSKSLDSSSLDDEDPAAKGPKTVLSSLSGGKRRLARHPVYLPLFLTKKRSAIAFMHRLLPSWVHASPSLHPRAVSDAANAAMAAARALWLAGDAAAGGFPAHLVEMMKARYSRISSPHGAALYERGEAAWVMDIARALVLDAIAEAEDAARAAAAACRHGALADAVVGRGSEKLPPPTPPPPSWPALRRLQEELLWMRDARMIHEAEERLAIDAVQSRAERQREQASKQERKRAVLSKMRSEASASTARKTEAGTWTRSSKKAARAAASRAPASRRPRPPRPGGWRCCSPSATSATRSRRSPRRWRRGWPRRALRGGGPRRSR